MINDINQWDHHGRARKEGWRGWALPTGQTGLPEERIHLGKVTGQWQVK